MPAWSRLKREWEKRIGTVGNGQLLSSAAK